MSAFDPKRTFADRLVRSASDPLRILEFDWLFMGLCRTDTFKCRLLWGSAPADRGQSEAEAKICMSWLTALVLTVPALLAVLITWEVGGRLWRRLKGSGRSAHVIASHGYHTRNVPAQALHLLRWQLVLPATVFVVAGIYYSLKDDAPLPTVMCINGADASGHSWPDERGRPDPCADYRR